MNGYSGADIPVCRGKKHNRQTRMSAPLNISLISYLHISDRCGRITPRRVFCGLRRYARIRHRHGRGGHCGSIADMDLVAAGIFGAIQGLVGLLQEKFPGEIAVADPATPKLAVVPIFSSSTTTWELAISCRQLRQNSRAAGFGLCHDDGEFLSSIAGGKIRQTALFGQCTG